jgi:hypothetical protein
MSADCWCWRCRQSRLSDASCASLAKLNAVAALEGRRPSYVDALRMLAQVGEAMCEVLQLHGIKEPTDSPEFLHVFMAAATVITKSEVGITSIAAMQTDMDAFFRAIREDANVGDAALAPTHGVMQ